MGPLYCIVSLTEAAKLPRYTNSKPATVCTQAADCGDSGCCLNGVCSLTGRVWGACYKNVTQNGAQRPAGVWTATDLCPCEYTHYCYINNISPRNSHPKYGNVGSCYPIMG
ncbi:unnamed protein product [Candidula unifasciata]|uniref:Uncharacterized protein n=1 Tax=Candidula unifasciata TaxID=100452 RepID=A0A8S3Z3K9_9EUPU|nr:unnamed protein product [Candidula unifasciata]